MALAVKHRLHPEGGRCRAVSAPQTVPIKGAEADRQAGACTPVKLFGIVDRYCGGMKGVPSHARAPCAAHPSGRPSIHPAGTLTHVSLSDEDEVTNYIYSKHLLLVLVLRRL